MSTEAIPPAAPTLPLSLAALPIGTTANIVRLHADTVTTHYLRAMGLREGEQMRVLRHALFGGPLHVERSCGGQFAVARALAEQIEVERCS